MALASYGPIWPEFIPVSLGPLAKSCQKYFIPPSPSWMVVHCRVAPQPGIILVGSCLYIWVEREALQELCVLKNKTMQRPLLWQGSRPVWSPVRLPFELTSYVTFHIVSKHLDQDTNGNHYIKGATSPFVYFEKNGLNFSKSSFSIRFNLLHPQPPSFLFALESPLWCFSSLANHYL